MIPPDPNITGADFPPARSLWQRLIAKPFRGLLDLIGFRWNAKKQKYVDGADKPVDVRKLASEFVEACKKEVRSLARYAIEPETLPDWVQAMASTVKSEYVAVGALASGGFHNFTKKIGAVLTGVKDKVGATLNYNFGRLADFVSDIVDGNKSEAQIGARSELYAASGWGAFSNARRESHAAVFTLERNVLDDAAHHCHATEFSPSCPEITEAGWLPLGAMPLPGTRPCMTHCRCFVEYQ
jgi:hypothetical protein